MGGGDGGRKQQRVVGGDGQRRILTEDVEQEVEHSPNDLGHSSVGRDVHEELPEDGVEAHRLKEDDEVDEEGLGSSLGVGMCVWVWVWRSVVPFS